MLQNAPRPEQPPRPGGEPPRSNPHGYRVGLILGGANFGQVSRHTRRWMLSRPGSWNAQLGYSRDGDGPREIVLRRDLDEFREEISVRVGPGPTLRGTPVGVRRTIAPYWAPDAALSAKLVDVRTYRGPSLVPSLVDTFSAYQDREIVTFARRPDREETAALTEYLRDPARSMPVLVVSLAHGSRRPVLDADRLARALTGLAHVYLLNGGWCAEIVGEALGAGLECCGGTIRLYWPGLAPGDPAGRHPRWDPHLVQVAGRSFALEVLRTLGLWRRAREEAENGRAAS